MAAVGEVRKAWAFNAGTALKRLTMLALIALTFVTIWIHEAYFFAGPSPQLQRLQPFMPWLAPHIATGAMALLLGALQFSTTLRKRSLTLHRWLGRLYVASVLISAPLALYIILTFEAESARWVMGAMAALCASPIIAGCSTSRA